MTPPLTTEAASPLEQQFKDAFRSTGLVTNTDAWALSDAAMAVHRAALATSQPAGVELGLPFEEMERLANKWGDFDSNHGGAFIFSADPAARFNVFSFVQECIDEAVTRSQQENGQ